MAARVSTEYGEIHRRVLALESDLDLFSLSADGAPVWELIRKAVVEAVMAERGLWGQPYAPVERTAGERLRGASMLAANLLRRNPYLAGEREVLAWSLGRRTREADGRWWNVYCDPVYEAATFDYLHAEEPYRNRHRRPARTDSLAYLDAVVYSGLLARRVGLARVDLPTDVARTLETLRRGLREDPGVDVDPVRIARDHLAARRSTRPQIARLIDRVNPRLAIVVPHSGREPFVEVCRERGVPVVELQHGVVHEYAYEYSFPGDRTKEAFPDYLLTWGPFWNDAAAYPIPPERVVATGFPYLDERRGTYADAPTRERVVFVSQGENGERLSRLAAELADRGDVAATVVYKLHPGEYDRWRAAYPWLARSAVEVVADSRPLYRLFAESTAQVGGFSTALYEGLAFGLDTYLVEVPGVEWLSPLLDDGTASLVRSADDLAVALASPRRDPVDVDRFFAPDAAATTVAELERLLEEG